MQKLNFYTCLDKPTWCLVSGTCFDKGNRFYYQLGSITLLRKERQLNYRMNDIVFQPCFQVGLS